MTAFKRVLLIPAEHRLYYVRTISAVGGTQLRSPSRKARNLNIVTRDFLIRVVRLMTGPRRGPVLACALVFISLLAAIYAFVPRSPHAEFIPISQVVADVRAGKVSEIVVVNDSNQIEIHYAPAYAPASPTGGTGNVDAGARQDAQQDVRQAQLKYAYKEGTISLQETLIQGGVSPQQLPEITVKQPDYDWSRAVGVLLPAALLAGVMLYVLRYHSRQNVAFGRSRARLLHEAHTGVTFEDVAGVDEARAELVELVEFLRDPARFAELGARIPRGVLMVGPPGTGKTLVSRAVAGEAGVPFFSASGSEFVEMFVGVGASRVRDLFAQAKQQAPCLVFIDEIDAIGRNRASGGTTGAHEEREQTLNQLLVEMDGFEPSAGIIVIGATNRPDVLDPALLRPGRFDRQVVLDRPDIRGRTAILQVHARGKPLAPDVSLDTIARMTPGFTGAELANVINEAAILAVRQGRKAIGMQDMEEAIDRVIAGPARKSRIISEHERAVTAYHEVGHAIVARMMPHVDPVHKITIVSRGMAGGYTRVLPGEDRMMYSRQQFKEMMAFILGGRAAEEIVFGDVTTGAGNDLERVTDLARQMVMRYGMGNRLGLMSLGRRSGGEFLGNRSDAQINYSEEVARQIDEEVRDLVNEAYSRAKEVLVAHMDRLIEISEALIERETLDADEFEAFFAGIPRPERKTHRPRPARSIKRGEVRTSRLVPAVSTGTAGAGLIQGGERGL